MPQGLGKNLYPTLSVFENIDFFARLFGLSGAGSKRRITELLGSIGLGRFPDRPCGRIKPKAPIIKICALAFSRPNPIKGLWRTGKSKHRYSCKNNA